MTQFNYKSTYGINYDHTTPKWVKNLKKKDNKISTKELKKLKANRKRLLKRVDI